MAEHIASGLLEACVVVGASNDKLKELYESLQQENGVPLPLLDPEVLQVHAPPFVTKENMTEPGIGHFSRGQRRRSFIKKKSNRPGVAPGNTKSSEGSTGDVSVPKDLDLVALPQLCFPGGLQVSKQLKDDHFHFLVFTDVFGNQTHGVVVHYYRLIQINQLFQEGAQHQNGHVHKHPQFYAPYGVCIISKHPYYTALKDCLSCLLGQLKTCRMADLDERVKEFSAKLALVPIPPPGPLHVMFTLRPLTIVLPSREDKDRPVIDLDLHLPFLCFTPRVLLQIITSILTEQRLVFFSSNWARLTLMAECFMLYIHPLRWQHPLVPTLSRQMLDFLMAPTAFLMGCHLNHYQEVATETDDLILINVDEGTISSDHADIPEAPRAAAECFKRRRNGLHLHYDVEAVHQGACMDINDLRMRRRRWQENLNWEIQKVTLEFIVNIFRDVSDHLNYEHRVFNTEEFLKTREPVDQQFYKKVLESHIFHSFLKDRLSRKTDAFTRMELSTRTEAQKMKAGVENPRRPTMQEMARKYNCPENRLSKRLGTSLPNLGEEKHLSIPRHASVTKAKAIPDISLDIPAKQIKIFKLPEFPPPLVYQYVHHYYGEVTHQLGKAMASLPTGDSSLLARYYYLRGLVNTLNSKRLEALSDFQNLYKTDVELFPGELVRTLVDSLQKEERAQAERRSELRRLLCKLKSDEKSELVTDDHVKKFQLPKISMHLEEFVTCIQESGIVRDMATIHRLFEALTDGQQKVVDPELFRVFYTFWRETEAEAQDVHLPSEVIEHLDNNECVYKLSSSVKTNHGVGKIAMTQKRLFLLTEGRPGYVEITKFRDIEEVKISAASFLLLRIPSLKIKSSLRKEVFEANLKSECDLWSLMVKEMWAGRRMADDHKHRRCVDMEKYGTFPLPHEGHWSIPLVIFQCKTFAKDTHTLLLPHDPANCPSVENDPQHMQQALANVLLMDAVVGCLQSPKATVAASKLAYYDKMKKEVPMMVPKTTVEALKHRINPSLCMTTPQTVDVLLYTPGQLLLSDCDLDGTPKLWCALRHGTVVVFDAASWSMQQNCIQVGTKQLNCMLGLDQEQVWIGSQDSVIYIINTRSMSCHKQLTEHRAEVMDFALEEKSSKYSHTQVYSCSADGFVIVWDVLTLKVKKQFHLDCEGLQFLKLYNGTLWCGARDCIMEVRKSGALHRKLSLPEAVMSTNTTFSSFLLLVEAGEIWTSFSDSGELCVWALTDLTAPSNRIILPECTGVTCMIKVKDQIWVGCHGSSPMPSSVSGKIFVLDSESCNVRKELQAHTDSVQALCSAENRYVFSGSAKHDGKIAIWKVE
ncbi:DENN domain-containing protein 3 isoform X2 [Colossoma macropomum]|uniref:DENN domain-containing protein 3 isoform X2 n=1 Tax=Colossoma macropomum TaxID=42526 RepID=UPI0018640EC2|nr:DENN domain-containing protein 3 isoform X2 [Colossoma macropomum]